MGRVIQASSVIGTTEGDFRSELVKKLRATRINEKKLLVGPIETGTTWLGVSDIFIRTTKVGVWMELKRLYYPLPSRWTVPFRPGQYTFLRDYYELGGTSVLAIATQHAIIYFMNASIQEEYEFPCELPNMLAQKRINARELIQWLDTYGRRRE
jgi:hypothetical protein